MKRIATILVLCCCVVSILFLTMLPAEEETAKPEKPSGTIIVLDPGHGGKDSGAVGPGGIFEKDVVLKIGLRVKKMLEDEGFTVLMTRDKDVFVPLRDRAEIANDAGANVFLSIHANASQGGGGWGFETFFLSLTASDEWAGKTALAENEAVHFESPEDDDLPDEVNSDIEAILMDMAQTEHIRESEHLAVTIQDHLDNILKSPNRGVKQAPFMVLMGAAMPAALVEIGFVSSRKESKILTEPEMQEKIAKSLSDSLALYARNRAVRLGVSEHSKSTCEKEL